jgi:hypothetical protein
MRKLAVLALLALSLFTVACTESEDVGTGDEAAAIDDVDGLAIDGEAGSLTERGVPSDDGATTADRVTGGYQRPAHVSSGEPTADRIGANGAALPGQPATGVLECVTARKLDNGEPVFDTVTSTELGARAAIRYQQLGKLRAFRQ